MPRKGVLRDLSLDAHWIALVFVIRPTLIRLLVGIRYEEDHLLGLASQDATRGE